MLAVYQFIYTIWKSEIKYVYRAQNIFSGRAIER